LILITYRVYSVPSQIFPTIFQFLQRKVGTPPLLYLTIHLFKLTPKIIGKKRINVITFCIFLTGFQKSTREYAEFYKKVVLLVALADSNIPELQEQICKLREITDAVEDIHRRSTAGSLVGGVFAAVGGITAAVGFVLVPFTFGASLVVAEAGAIVAVGGGAASAACNVLSAIHKKVSRDDIEKALEIFNKRLSPINKCLEDIQIKLKKLPRENEGQFNLRLRGIMMKEIMETIAESGMLVGRTLRSVATVMTVVSSIFVVLDIFFIVSDYRELEELENPPSSSQIKSNTVQFLQKMKEIIQTLKQAVGDIKSVTKTLQRLPSPRMLMS
uniref:Uncharacterized protein n=1 Tax=Astyanax mexicanus TaxID=7994 RepID=A0A3B1J1R2_ASTMX